MKTAIIIPTRLASSRVPKKAIHKINGTPLIVHLVEFIKNWCKLPIILATPEVDREIFANLFPDLPIVSGDDSDPLARMHRACKAYGVETAIRVCHDKFLIDHRALASALAQFETGRHDYLYSSSVIDGAGFEIISADLLRQASEEFVDVEFISYAVRLLAKNQIDFQAESYGPIQPRLLIDFPEDIQFAELLISQLGMLARLEDIVEWLKENQWAMKINKLPLITVYTCALNADQTIENTIASVVRQTVFDSCEYLLIDDHSKDLTPSIMAREAIARPNIKWYRNQQNLGLASSSNIALKNARGKYIIRIDADDVFVPLAAIESLLKTMVSKNLEAVYPDNYFGTYTKIQKGKKSHHVGGAIFDKRALNFLKFTDGLRGYEGLDLFLRAEKALKIGYHDEPIFLYTQRDGSMSRTNLKIRSKIKKEILERVGL